MVQLVKNPPAVWETWVLSLPWEDPLEKGTVTLSSILAWRISWTHSPWDHKESEMTEKHSLNFKSLVGGGAFIHMEGKECNEERCYLCFPAWVRWWNFPPEFENLEAKDGQATQVEGLGA